MFNSNFKPVENDQFLYCSSRIKGRKYLVELEQKEAIISVRKHYMKLVRGFCFCNIFVVKMNAILGIVVAIGGAIYFQTEVNKKVKLILKDSPPII